MNYRSGFRCEATLTAMALMVAFCFTGCKPQPGSHSIPTTPTPPATPPGAQTTDPRDTMAWPLTRASSQFRMEEWLEADAEKLRDMVTASSSTKSSRTDPLRIAEFLLAENTPAVNQAAEKILRIILSETPDGSLGKLLSPSGRAAADGQTSDRQKTRDILALKKRAQAYAFLYLATGNPTDAENAAAILKQFATVMPQWPLFDRDGKRQSRTDSAYLSHWRANGLWDWHPLDLENSLPLLRAYDGIRSRLSDSDRAFIEENIFLQHKALIDQFTGLLPLYHNLAGNHLIPLIRFGQVLNRPDFVHAAIQYYQEYLAYSYAPDGFYRELTPDYYQQITSKIVGTIPNLLKNYSDPVGYRHPVTGLRYDNFDLAAQNADRLQTINSALEILAMPDRSYANINDSWPKRLRFPGTPAEASRPGLLGISGVAKLGTPGMAAFLQFGGIRGHDHLDGLNLIWYAAGREVFSDTGYQPISGSGSSREWHTITASHNTVAVDEASHFQERENRSIPERKSGVAAFPPSQQGKHPVEANLPAAAGFSNQGRLLIWNTTHSRAQAMEAEQADAYPGKTSLFRRTLVMVPLDDDEGYLLDIFRIRGGQTHDYFFRGGLNEPYTLTTTASLEPVNGQKAYGYIDVKEKALLTFPAELQVAFADGKTRVHSTLAQVFGTPGATSELFLGEAPAIRRKGNATFSFIRRSLGTEAETGLESCFVWVHEATRGPKRVLAVETELQGDTVIVRVKTTAREDVFFSSTQQNSEATSAAIQFQGRLGLVTVTNNEAEGILFGSGMIKWNDSLVLQQKPTEPYPIRQTTSRDLGEKNNSVFISKSLPDRTFHLAHIDLGETIRYSIPVQQIHQEAEGSRIELSHSPGFSIAGDTVLMNQFPGWRIQGSATVTLE